MSQEILGKIAVDKQQEKLGKIIRIEKLLGKTVKKDEPYAMILVRKFLRSDVIIPLETEKIKNIEEKQVTFDIMKSEFEKIIQEQKILKEERRNSGEYVRFREKWYGPGHARLAPRDRQTRRK